MIASPQVGVTGLPTTKQFNWPNVGVAISQSTENHLPGCLCKQAKSKGVLHRHMEIKGLIKKSSVHKSPQGANVYAHLIPENPYTDAQGFPTAHSLLR